jgi:CO/xanthine dehydrogenase FAD-binding subunit
MQDALEVLAAAGADVRILAGGTNVVPNMRNARVAPALLLDIGRLDELRGIEAVGDATDRMIRIGALTTVAELLASDLIREEAPALHDAAAVFADPVTRLRATVGGNITNASPGADAAPPLYALDAQVTLERLKGASGTSGNAASTPGGAAAGTSLPPVAGDQARTARLLPIGAYITGSMQTARAPQEMLTYITFSPCRRSAFTKLGLRRAMAISVETVAVALALAPDGGIETCRIAVGALGSTPLRLAKTEKLFAGKKPGEGLFAAAADALKTEIHPRDGLRGTKAYRNATAGVLLERTMAAAYGR